MITTGPDGKLWSPLGNLSILASVTTDGTLSGYQLSPDESIFAEGITTGPNDTLWFTDASQNKLGVISGLVEPTPNPAPSESSPAPVTGFPAPAAAAEPTPAAAVAEPQPSPVIPPRPSSDTPNTPKATTPAPPQPAPDYSLALYAGVGVASFVVLGFLCWLLFRLFVR